MNNLRFYLKSPKATIRKFSYFLIHPLIIIKHKINLLKLKNNKGINSRSTVSSKLPIDVVFPTIAKDFEVVGAMIDSVREYVMHPIGKIYIISPDTKEIKDLCSEKGCVFVDENKVLPITKKDIHYTVGGEDRSGWLFQQFLKWAANDLVETDNFLITESDTVFIRPRVFSYEGKTIIPCSNGLPHIPYFEAYERLLGTRITPVYNFTSHHSLFSKKRLSELKKAIEKHCGTVWYQAIIDNIDQNEGSSVSDYETYAQYVYNNYPEEIILEHWGNLSLSRKEVKELPKLKEQHRAKYKVISFHSYNS